MYSGMRNSFNTINDSNIKMMNGKLREILKLIRLWNLPTALADSFCGFFIAAGGDARAASLRAAGAMLISAFVYAAGMAWNDILDLERDRKLHPDRPLPSGRLRKKSAGRFAAALMLAALIAGAIIGNGIVLIVLLLIVLTFLYNAWSKHKGMLGCLNMGACRFVNMSLGIAAAGGSIGDFLPYPATLGIYVAAATLLSLQEESKLSRRGFFVMAAMPVLVLVPPGVVSILRAGSVPYSWLAVLPLFLLGTWIFAAAAGAYDGAGEGSGAGSPNVGSVVRVAVSGVILLDSALLLSAGRIVPAAVCVSLLIPTVAFIRLLARRPATAAS